MPRNARAAAFRLLPDEQRELLALDARQGLDYGEIAVGLTVPYSSGAVECHVNRLKMIKRHMYGRAKPGLLRKRVLLAD